MRQKPGPTNALGLVKLMFPNEYNVYLHSTPAPQLFSQTRRDFSHGCIRVEKPAELAAWVLRDKSDWSLERAQAAMSGGRDNVQVNLTKPIPVLILYGTSVVDPDGQRAVLRRHLRLRRRTQEGAREGLSVSGLARRERLPAPDAADVHMNEIGFGVISDTAAMECQSRISNMGSADAG